MNAILVTNKGDELTHDELEHFNEAKKIVKLNNKNGNKKRNIIIALLIVLLIGALVFCTIFALLNMGSDKIQNNIKIMGIDVSNITQDEAKARINQTIEERLATDLILKHNDETYTMLPSEIQFSYDINSAIEEAYLVGRKGNIFQNNFTILKQKNNLLEITPKVEISESMFEEFEPKLNEGFQDGVKQPEYNRDGNNLIIKPGKNGYKVNLGELKDRIINKMLLSEYNTDSIEIPVVEGKCDDIDIDSLHSTIYKDAVDATFTKNPYNITASETGLDFNISIDEAKAIITGDKEEYVIPLKILYPNVSTDDISLEAFPDKLATYTTNYSSSSYSRANNVELAAKKIDGTVLMPGDVFSYNDTVGKRTKQAGFQEAPAYANGKVVNEVGGGICQVSSTLYNTVLRSNLEIVDRSNHMFQVGYVPIGTDATVSWGAPDLKFKNNRNYAIKIVTGSYGRNLTIDIYGLKQENDYDVEIVSYRTGTVGYRTTYTTDSSLGKGKTKVIQSGSNGATSVTYRILKQNGAEVSREVVSRDTYQPHNKIVARGN
ncbi:MAG: VanW family protein [Clostridia bacterium]|nr:VanW family protein [Clostridia bacterium]